MASSTMTVRGTVKNWKGGRGFGFITTQERGDVFCHVSQLSAELRRMANSGQLEGVEVTFEVTKTPKGLAAAKVSRPGDDKPVIEGFMAGEGQLCFLRLEQIANHFEVIWQDYFSKRTQKSPARVSYLGTVIGRDSKGLFMAKRSTRYNRSLGTPSLVIRDLDKITKAYLEGNEPDLPPARAIAQMPEGQPIEDGYVVFLERVDENAGFAGEEHDCWVVTPDGRRIGVAEKESGPPVHLVWRALKAKFQDQFVREEVSDEKTC